MSILKDPTKPAGHLVEVREDGSALRNDGVELTPASQNPWYVLATVYGEPKHGYDWQLNERNRRIWNGWVCEGKSSGEIERIAAIIKVPPKELYGLTSQEQADVNSAFMKRLSKNAKIPSPADRVEMSKTYFAKRMVFDKFIFEGIVSVRFSAFGMAATFRDTSFSSTAIFHSTSFLDAASFQAAKFSKETYFNSVKFCDTAEFSDNAFQGQTVFIDTCFHGDVPKFYQRTLHQDTEFTTLQSHWPILTKANASDSKRAYTRLRQMMNELHKPDDEHFFFRQEMRCKLLLEDWWNRWPIRIFWLLSDYGYSVMRPAAWLAGVVGVGWGIIGSHLRYCVPTPLNASIWEGLGVSISNTFPFLGFHRKWHGGFFDHTHILIDILSGAQSILGIILLFFLGLGLRNRFRIK